MQRLFILSWTSVCLDQCFLGQLSLGQISLGHCRKQSSNFSLIRNRYYGSVSGSRKSHFWLQKLIHNNSFWIQKLTWNVSFWLKNLWIQKLRKWISFMAQKLTQNVSFWSQKLTLWAIGTISCCEFDKKVFWQKAILKLLEERRECNSSVRHSSMQ